jgi:hypothetical protein
MQVDLTTDTPLTPAKPLDHVCTNARPAPGQGVVRFEQGFDIDLIGDRLLEDFAIVGLALAGNGSRPGRCMDDSPRRRQGHRVRYGGPEDVGFDSLTLTPQRRKPLGLALGTSLLFEFASESLKTLQ